MFELYRKSMKGIVLLNHIKIQILPFFPKVTIVYIQLR